MQTASFRTFNGCLGPGDRVGPLDPGVSYEVAKGPGIE